MKRCPLQGVRDIQKIVNILLATENFGGLGPQIAERANYRCEYCGLDFLASPENYKLWQTDHIIPKRSGGSDDFSNLALACRHCNCDWKRRWNPALRVGLNATREDMIDASRLRIREERAKTQAEIERIRAIVGWPDFSSDKLGVPTGPSASPLYLNGMLDARSGNELLDLEFPLQK